MAVCRQATSHYLNQCRSSFVLPYGVTEPQWVQLEILGNQHDDVIKWKYFPRYWPFVRGIHRSPVNSPHKGQWRGALMFSLICARINGWVKTREAGDLRRYHAHYDVIVMSDFVFVSLTGWRHSTWPTRSLENRGTLDVNSIVPMKIAINMPRDSVRVPEGNAVHQNTEKSETPLYTTHVLDPCTAKTGKAAKRAWNQSLNFQLMSPSLNEDQTI